MTDSKAAVQRPEEQDLMTAAEVATLLHVSRKTVYRLAWRRALPFYRVLDMLRFRRDDVEAWRGRSRVESIDHHHL